MYSCVSVSTHAMEQWRERAGIYGDEDGKFVIAALRESKLEDGPLPFARVDGCHYWLHPSGCWLVVDAKTEVGRVITVLENHSRKEVCPPTKRHLQSYDDVEDVEYRDLLITRDMLGRLLCKATVDANTREQILQEYRDVVAGVEEYKFKKKMAKEARRRLAEEEKIKFGTLPC